jgi:hypothetical protein
MTHISACPTRCFRFLTTWYASIPKATFAVASPGRSIPNGSRRVQPTTISSSVPRIEAGRTLSAADYMAMLRDRTVMVRAMDARLSDLDALASLFY